MEISDRFTRLEKFPRLLEYLTGLVAFYDGAEFEGMSESQAQEAVFMRFEPGERSKVLRQVVGLAADSVLPVQEISNAAYRYFADESEARAWLANLTEVMERVVQEHRS